MSFWKNSKRYAWVLGAVVGSAEKSTWEEIVNELLEEQ